MSIPHAASGDVVDVRPLAARLRDTVSVAIVRDDRIEVMRLVLPADKRLPEHLAHGPITIQCIEGSVELTAHDAARTLQAGDLVYLAARVPHAVRAVTDASLLVTMVLDHGVHGEGTNAGAGR